MAFSKGLYSLLVASVSAAIVHAGLVQRTSDPCAAIAGQKWVAPSEVRACFNSIPFDASTKANILEVVSKTLAFHTSVNFQIQAPAPFSEDVHENLFSDFSRISRQRYSSDFELHVDMSRTLKRLNDGHCVYINQCYDSLFLTFLPTPLVLLTDSSGVQNVHIAPEAFSVASAEFADEIDFWQNALPGSLKGQLSSLAGAKVLRINGADPFVAVDANAAITGSFQSFGTRQNSFFASYNRGTSGWSYIMGNFAQMSLPLTDSATLTIQRVGSNKVETITLPYRSRIGATAVPWTDKASFLANNCVATPGTNGVDAYASSTKRDDGGPTPEVAPVGAFQQQPSITPRDRRLHALNVLLDTAPQLDITLPPGLTPPNPVSGSNGVSQFFMLDDGKTGVLALGSFSAGSFDQLEASMLNGLLTLKNSGATQLIVDVTGNGGGFICLAHWLHRIIAGPKGSTEPQAGLNTIARAGPLAKLITEAIINQNADPDDFLLYNPINWAAPNGTQFTSSHNWLEPSVKKIINRKLDMFSPTMSDICQPFDMTAPSEPLFDTTKVAIVSNGRCASSCSLFSITMSKLEGSKTVVVGGKKDTPQQYCGTVGGQSTDFSTMDTEVKTTHLKSNVLAPPDFKTNSIQGITWRLGLGIDDPTQPEEWQNHPADVNLPLTTDTVNNPVAIWKQVVATVF